MRLRRVLPGARLEGRVQLPRDRLRVAHERDLGRDVRANLLRRDVHLDDPHFLVEARRVAEVHDPVEARAHQQDHVGVLQRVRTCRARWRAGGRPASRPCPSARRGRAAASLRGTRAPRPRRGNRRQPLPTITSGRSADFSAAIAALDVLLRRQRAGRLGAARREVQLFLFDGARDDVAGEVQVGGAGAAVDGLADGLLDVVREPGDAVRPRRRTSRTGGRPRSAALPGTRPGRSGTESLAPPIRSIGQQLTRRCRRRRCRGSCRDRRRQGTRPAGP